MIRHYITIFITASLLFAACETPTQRQYISNADFEAFFSDGYRITERNPDSARRVLYVFLEQTKADDQIINRIKTLNFIGSTYDVEGKYDSAAYFLYEAQNLAASINADSLQCSMLGNLGIIQFELGKTDAAVDYYKQAIAIAEKLHDTIKIINMLNNIGNAYMTLDNALDTAAVYLERCVELGLQSGYDLGVKVAGINLAQIYTALGDYDKGMNEAKMIIEKYGGNIYADFTIAMANFKKGNYREALRLYRELLNKRLNTREFELAIITDAAAVCDSIGDLRSEIAYLHRYHEIKDSIHDEQSEKTVNDLKIAYETEKKELKISVLEEEKQFILWFAIAGIAILFLILATLFFRNRLNVQKRKMAEQQILKLEQEKQLVATQAVLDGETAERSRLARDLHDGLGGMLSAVKLNLNEMKHDTAQFEKTVALLDDSIKEMRRVAHHLMPDSLIRYGLKTALADFCRSVPNTEFNYYGEHQRIDNKLEVVIYRIVHELVNNAIKHATAEHVMVQIVQEHDRFAFSVEDDGCGFDPSKVTEGMGLQNIRTRVTSFGGTLDLRSSKENGTEVNVEFKL
jgi:signal transduction histidine kinase